MDHEALLGQLPERLLPWYDACARDLPWRQDPTPYRVWVSEIMLQQTRVEAVKPHYQRFLQAFPTVGALAAAPEDRLLKMWEGLGYYSRARNMQKAARILEERYGGELPASFRELRALPGFGDYTAGAVASIAFGIPVPAVDGNVLRVAARVLDFWENVGDPRVKRQVEEALSAVLPPRVGDFNQSLMELGALVCLPGPAPKCGVCPLGDLCRARAAGTAGELPVKAKPKPRRREDRTVFLLFCGQKLALRRRPETGLLAGLWELPAAEGALSRQEAEGWLCGEGARPGELTPGPGAKHVFSHVEWHMAAWVAEVPEEAPGFAWVSAANLREACALPSAFKAYLPLIRQRLGG